MSPDDSVLLGAQIGEWHVPAFCSHPDFALASPRSSQALANLHSRFTVLGEMPIEDVVALDEVLARLSAMDADQGILPRHRHICFCQRRGV
jgi:hypothetical protein